MTERTPSEGQPPTFVQIQQLNRSLTEKVLDRAANDPQWKQLLLDDPQAAIREANFPEAQQLPHRQAGAKHEVRGQSSYREDERGVLSGGVWQGCYYQCYWLTWDFVWNTWF